MFDGGHIPPSALGNLEGERKPKTITTDMQKEAEMKDEKVNFLISLSFYSQWLQSIPDVHFHPYP